MHEFWSTQPVPNDKINYDKDGEIDASHNRNIKSIILPDGYVWSCCSLQELYPFLLKHYISGDVFDFAYSEDMIIWSLYAPGFKEYWHIAIREESSGKLAAFISGVPLHIRVIDNEIPVTQVNFLCVRSDLRSMGFAPLLIREITRRSNIYNVWQAVYTASICIPTPVCQVDYWHRLLNVEKLNRLGFSDTDESKHMLQGKTCLRKMTDEDVSYVTKLFKDHTSSFKIAPVVNEEYVRYWLLPRRGILYSYVDKDKDKFVSFYSVPLVHRETGEIIHQAYIFYMVGDSLNDAAHIAKKEGFDMLNCTNAGIRNSELLKNMFCMGDGTNHYYLYNWATRDCISREDICLTII